MKLVVLAAGKLKDAWARQGCDEYAKRIARHLPIELVEVKDAAALDAKAADLKKSRLRLVVLDERGKQPTSRELADKLGSWMVSTSGMQGVCFVLGEADGLHPDTVKRADELISLSKLTLPHRLARVLLMEQLYRALSILRREPYHRD